MLRNETHLDILCTMITHFFTLRALARELDPLLHHVSIGAVFTQHKNELIIALDRIPSISGQDAHPALIVSVAPRFNYLLLREDVVRARRNSLDLFPDACSRAIEHIDVLPADRIVSLALDNGMTFLLRLYNSAASNILLVDSRHTIIDAFKNGKDLAGTTLQVAEIRSGTILPDDPRQFAIALTTADAPSMEAALRRALPRFGSTLVREILFRASVEPSSPGTADHGTIDRLYHAALDLVRDAEQSRPIIYRRGGDDLLFSTIPLRHLGDVPGEASATVNEGVRTTVSRRFREGKLEADRRAMAEAIRAKLDQAKRSLDRVLEQRDTEGSANESERQGNALLGNLQMVKKGMTAVTVPDHGAAGGALHIVLDPKLTPVQNAARYFDRAKKLKASMVELSERAGNLREEIEQLERLASDLDSCETVKDLREFIESQRDALASFKLAAGAAEKETPPFGVFAVAGS